MTTTDNSRRIGTLDADDRRGGGGRAVPFGPVRLRRGVERIGAALADRLGEPALADAVVRTLQCCGRGFRCRRPAVAPTWTVAPLRELPESWPASLRDAMVHTLPSATARTDFLTWFLWDRVPADGGPPLGWRLFVDSRGELSPSFAWVARALWRSHYNVYEVVAGASNGHLAVRDLVFGETLAIRDEALAGGLQRWDLIVARLLRHERDAVVHSLHSVLPPGARASLERVVHDLSRPLREGGGRRCLLTQLKRQPYEFLKRCEGIFEECADPPDLTNLDGEPLVETRLYFRLRDRSAALAALERSPFLESLRATDASPPETDTDVIPRFVWLREGRRGARDDDVRPVLGALALDERYLVVTCNSRERGLAFQAGVERLLGPTAAYVSTVHTDFEQRLLFDAQEHGEHPWPDETILEDAPPSPALQQAYRQWLDAPLLTDDRCCGFTPREAARSGTGRWWLARHVNRLDTVQLRAGEPPVPIFFDLDVIRRVLGG